MTEIGFYHLTRTALDQALPKLLGRVLAQSGRAQVLLGNAERLAALDDALWKCADPDWLPHGSAAQGHAEMQPIWLTAEDAPAANGARFLFLVDGADSARFRGRTGSGRDRKDRMSRRSLASAIPAAPHR